MSKVSTQLVAPAPARLVYHGYSALEEQLLT